MSTNYISQITATNGTTYDISSGMTSRIFRATCSTAAATAAKVATLDDSTGYSLAAGVCVAVTFTYGNSAATPTLNVNSGGAKTIVYPSAVATNETTTSGSRNSVWGAYETVFFTYNGTYWVMGKSSLAASHIWNGTGTGSIIENKSQNTAIGNYSHAEGCYTQAIGNYSHAEGFGDEEIVKASGTASHAEGCDTIASGDQSHAEGVGNSASGVGSHAEGFYTEAIGHYSHSGGDRTRAKGLRAFAHGAGPKSYNNVDTTTNATIHTNFYNTIYGASGWYATAPTEYSSSDPRYGSIALGDYSVATGSCVLAYGFASNAEGCSTIAYGDRSHAQNCSTQAKGIASSAAGWGTIAGSDNQFVIGKWNTEDTNNKYAFIIGNGSGHASGTTFNRSDALTVDWDGKLTIEGHSSPIGDVKEASGSTSKSLGASSTVNLLSLALAPGVWLVWATASIASASGNKSTSFCIGQSATAMNSQLYNNNTRVDYFRSTTGSYITTVMGSFVNNGTANETCYFNVQTSVATTTNSYHMRAIRIA